jgi:hypothetical protein
VRLVLFSVSRVLLDTHGVVSADSYMQTDDTNATNRHQYGSGGTFLQQCVGCQLALQGRLERDESKPRCSVHLFRTPHGQCVAVLNGHCSKVPSQETIAAGRKHVQHDTGRACVQELPRFATVHANLVEIRKE